MFFAVDTNPLLVCMCRHKSHVKYAILVSLVILSIVPNGPPRNVRSVNKGSTWIHVAWDIPVADDRNGILISYIIGVTPRSGIIPVHLPNPTFHTPDLITYNITGLSPGTEYTVRVAASTVNGTGPFNTGSRFSTSDDRECSI